MLVCSRRVLANRNSLVMFLDAEALGNEVLALARMLGPFCVQTFLKDAFVAM